MQGRLKTAPAVVAKDRLVTTSGPKGLLPETKVWSGVWFAFVAASNREGRSAKYLIDQCFVDCP